MKLVDGFVLKEIAGCKVVVPLSTNTVSFRSIISLNETGAFLWEALEKETTEDELLQNMLKEYDVDEATAKADIAEFINTMKKANLLV